MNDIASADLSNPARVQVRGDYQQFDLDDEGMVSWVGDRMNAKLLAMEKLGLPGNFAEGKSILDVGTDHGFWSFLLASRGGARSVVGLDRGREVRGIGPVNLVAKNNSLARQFEVYNRVNFHKINLGLQFHEFGQFDVVLCMSVYHHIYAQCGDHNAVWYWLFRHVRPGGCLVWESPIDISDVVIQRNVPYHLHADYTVKTIAQAADRYFVVPSHGPAEHEPTRQMLVCWRKEVSRDMRIEKGNVATGAGGATKAFTRDGGKRMAEIEAALGFRPHPGSLNLYVSADREPDWDIDYYRAMIHDPIKRKEPNGQWAPRWCRFYPAIIGGVGAFAMRFEDDHYPSNFIELIAPHRLRDLIMAKGNGATQ